VRTRKPRLCPIQGRDAGPPIPRDGTLLGALFESLVTLNVRVYAQQAEAEVKHLRTHAGEHEVDLIVERADGHVVAIEVKLAETVDGGARRHLNWLAAEIGADLLDCIVVTTGKAAYRRDDGVAVVPAALLGPWVDLDGSRRLLVLDSDRFGMAGRRRAWQSSPV
jgi:predicted AAA+ superfamily ATPase